jgi:hypothetical protein
MIEIQMIFRQRDYALIFVFHCQNMDIFDARLFEQAAKLPVMQPLSFEP